MSCSNCLTVLTGLPDTHKPNKVKTAERKEVELFFGNIPEGYWFVMVIRQFFQPDSGIDFVNKREHYKDRFVG